MVGRVIDELTNGVGRVQKPRDRTTTGWKFGICRGGKGV